MNRPLARRNTDSRRLAVLVLLLCAVGWPPLLGALWTEAFPWTHFLELPPRTHYVNHAEIAWSAVWGFAAVGLAGLIWCVCMAFGPQREPAKVPARKQHRFPWWSILGIAAVGLGWSTAWSRAELMKPVQPFSFVMIWCGYILLAESLVVRLGGRSSYQRWGSQYLALFPISILFWWMFELLNRFVQNWSYPALEQFGALEYVSLASIAFSTVLPAVLATERVLVNFTVESAHAPLLLGRRAAWLSLAISAALLALMPSYPNQLFAVVWLSPLVAGLGLAQLFDLPGPVSMRQPEALARWALAALICGFFWELWNVQSAFKWIYHIPYVQLWHVFEMPLLGFAGYLPFGVLCGLVIEWSAIDASER